MPIILEGEPSVREKIFRASVDWFMSKGYDKVSLRQLARELGISHNTILHYYGSKEGLGDEFIRRFRKLMFEKAYTFYQQIPDHERIPEMGLLTYHALLYKYAEADTQFGHMYYELRSHSGAIMIETNSDDFFVGNMTNLFPGFHYRNLSDADFQLGLTMVNHCTLGFLHHFLKGKITISKILTDYFHIYTYFLLDVSYPDTFAADYYNKYMADLKPDVPELLQELLSYKSFY